MYTRGSPAAAARARGLGVDAFGVVAPHGLAAVPAVQRGRAREQQLQVIVELGHRADGGARGAHRIRLVDGDGRRNAVDAVHRGLVHAIEELARVRREGLDVAPLALGVQRVEHQRGLARARHARDHHEFLQRNLEVEVLEIVLTRAANHDRRARPRLRPGRATAGRACVSDGLVHVAKGIRIRGSVIVPTAVKRPDVGIREPGSSPAGTGRMPTALPPRHDRYRSRRSTGDRVAEQQKASTPHTGASSSLHRSAPYSSGTTSTSTARWSPSSPRSSSRG